MGIESNQFFQAVKSHADGMLEFGRPLESETPCPLFAGVVDVGRKEVVQNFVVPPPGIRLGDFNWCGNNLMHDVNFLEALNALTRLTGDQRYAAAVDQVFEFYGANCPDPVTGLFPWGEHAQWSFPDQQSLPCLFGGGLKGLMAGVKHIIHDHLRFAPEWFWEQMWRHHPDAVVRFAHGLHGHIIDQETYRHSRHAPLTEHNWRKPTDPPILGGDFARHSGHYIFDTLFAFKKSGDRSLVDWARKKLGWHQMNRLPNGIVGGSINQPPQEGQHDALALSVADAADMLGRDTPEGKEFGDYADELFEARAKEAATRPPPAIEGEPDGSVWMSGYFRRAKNAFGWSGGSFALQVYERSKCQWFADAIVATARFEAAHFPPPPPNIPVLARTYASRVDNAISAYQLTGEPEFLKSAAKFGRLAMEGLYREGLFMGASNMRIFRAKVSSEYHVDEWAEPNTPGYYYSVSGTPILVRTLLRLALLEEGADDILGIDKHPR